MEPLLLLESIHDQSTETLKNNLTSLNDIFRHLNNCNKSEDDMVGCKDLFQYAVRQREAVENELELRAARVRICGLLTNQSPREAKTSDGSLVCDTKLQSSTSEAAIETRDSTLRVPKDTPSEARRYIIPLPSSLMGHREANIAAAPQVKISNENKSEKVGDIYVTSSSRSTRPITNVGTEAVSGSESSVCATTSVEVSTKTNGLLIADDRGENLGNSRMLRKSQQHWSFRATSRNAPFDTNKVRRSCVTIGNTSGGIFARHRRPKKDGKGDPCRHSDLISIARVREIERQQRRKRALHRLTARRIARANEKEEKKKRQKPIRSMRSKEQESRSRCVEHRAESAPQCLKFFPRETLSRERETAQMMILSVEALVAKQTTMVAVVTERRKNHLANKMIPRAKILFPTRRVHTCEVIEHGVVSFSMTDIQRHEERYLTSNAEVRAVAFSPLVQITGGIFNRSVLLDVSSEESESVSLSDDEIGQNEIKEQKNDTHNDGGYKSVHFDLSCPRFEKVEGHRGDELASLKLTATVNGPKSGVSPFSMHTFSTSRKLTCKDEPMGNDFHIRRSFDPSVNSPGAVHQVNRHHIMSINGGWSVTEGEVHAESIVNQGRKGQADRNCQPSGVSVPSTQAVTLYDNELSLEFPRRDMPLSDDATSGKGDLMHMRGKVQQEISEIGIEEGDNIDIGLQDLESKFLAKESSLLRPAPISSSGHAEARHHSSPLSLNHSTEKNWDSDLPNDAHDTFLAHYDTFPCIFSAYHEGVIKNGGESGRSSSGSKKRQKERLMNVSLEESILQKTWRLYTVWQQVMRDYATVFSTESVGSLSEEKELGRNALVYNGSNDGAALQYRVNSSSRPEVYSIVAQALKNEVWYASHACTGDESQCSIYQANWVEMPTGLGLGATWNLLWTWSKPRINYSSLLVWQRVNHFPRSRELTRKDLLKRNIGRMQQLCSGSKQHKDAFHIMPRTFVLPHEYNKFVNAFYEVDRVSHQTSPASDAAFATGLVSHSSKLVKRSKTPNDNEGEENIQHVSRQGRVHPHNFWILKPVGLSRGRGISLISDISDVKYDSQCVVQQYISNPLLINGFKWDMRLYVLVTSFQPLEAFLYREGERYHDIQLNVCYD